LHYIARAAGLFRNHQELLLEVSDPPYKMAVNIRVKVHPVVLFQIADAYERRDMEKYRVIGTLLGVIDKNTVEVKHSYCVRHKDNKEGIEIDIEYNQEMYELHKKISPGNNLIGWFTTGNEVTSSSSLIHDYYSRETKNPIHITVDTPLASGRMGIKAYIDVSIGVPKATSGSMFTPIPVEVVANEPVVSGINLLQKCITTKSRQAQFSTDLTRIAECIDKLLIMLSESLVYVTNAANGALVPNNAVGRDLLDMVNSVPNMTPDDFEKMITSNKNDLLMVIYLTQLTKTQLQLHEKLTAVSVNQLKDYQKLIPE